MKIEDRLQQEIDAEIASYKKMLEAIRSRSWNFAQQEKQKIHNKLYEAIAAASIAPNDQTKQNDEREAASNVLVFNLLARQRVDAIGYMEEKIKTANSRFGEVDLLRFERENYQREKKQLLERLDEKRELLDDLEHVDVRKERQCKERVIDVNSRLNLSTLERMADRLEEKNDFADFVREFKKKEKRLRLEKV